MLDKHRQFKEIPPEPPQEKPPIKVNGKAYPMWSQFVHGKDRWIGGTMEDYQGGGFYVTEIVDIRLEANGPESAMIIFVGKDFECGGDVQYVGIVANYDNDKALLLGGYAGHRWKIWSKHDKPYRPHA